MYDYNSDALPNSFNKLFTCIKEVHQYSIRLIGSKRSYCIPKPRTNYGIFNIIRFMGTKTWNSTEVDLKFKSRISFKHYLFNSLLVLAKYSD